MNNIRTMRKQAGFTLIELMIVIAILAILMAIAIPAYQDYSIRAKVAEGVNMAAPAKLAVAETMSSEGTLPTDSGGAGYSFPGTTSYVNGISIANGIITVVVNGTTTGIGANCNVVYTPAVVGTSNQLTWTCGSTCEFQFVPAECRNAP